MNSREMMMKNFNRKKEPKSDGADIIWMLVAMCVIASLISAAWPA